MFRLVKIELKKMFAKKTIYIFLAIVLVITAVSAYMEKSADKVVNFISGGLEAQMYKSSMEGYDLSDPEQVKYYVEDKTHYDVVVLSQDYKPSTPEYKFINDEMYETVYCLNENEFITKNQEAYNDCKKTYDEQVAFLKNYNWKTHIENEIRRLEEEVSLAKTTNLDENSIKSLNLQIDILKYRLDNKIPIDYSGASIALQRYSGAYDEYLQYENEKNLVLYNDKRDKAEAEKEYFIYKYKFDHKLIQNTTRSLEEDTLATGAASIFSYNMFALLFLVLVGGSVVAEEFNKGTIKQLLLKPFTRTKILTSKIIAVLVAFLFFLVVYSLMTVLIYGVTFGGWKSLVSPMIIYDYNTHVVLEHSLILVCLENLLAVLPLYLILLGVSLVFGVITTNNTIATILPVLCTIAADIINAFADKKIFAFLPTMCWDLTQFLHGGLPEFRYSTLPISIGIDCISILILYGIAYYVFRKKNIKNQ